MNTTVTPPVEEKKTEQKPRKKLTPKVRKRIITGAVALVLVGAIVAGMAKLLSKDSSTSLVNEATVYLGTITSMVEGSGVAKGQSTETITLTTAGTVLDVYVAEGDHVDVGTALFTVDSPNAQSAVMAARSTLEAKQKELENLQEAANNLTVRAEFAGKLMEVGEFTSGQAISAGTKLATLVDDRTLRLEQYYSYAYENDIRVGQSVTVSIPATMEQLSGKVAQVNKVSRISPEGSRLFQVIIEVANPGTLTADMVASASITANGQSIYPYEQGKLQYNRTQDVTAKASGKIISSAMLNYLDVSAGQVLMQIDGEDNETAIYNAQEAVNTAQEELDKAEKNLQNLNAVAPISGTVIGLTITPGATVEANTTVVSISDTSIITVTAQVDERNISHVKPGMMVNINQWGNQYMGTVESVSLNPEMSNGAAFYPATITVDNSAGTMVSGSSVTYSLEASRSDGCMVLPIQCVKYVPNPSSETGETISVVFLKADSAPENALEGVDGLSLGIPEGYYPVPVVTGIADKQNIEIKEGLNVDDVVFQNTTQDPNAMGGGGIIIG